MIKTDFADSPTENVIEIGAHKTIDLSVAYPGTVNMEAVVECLMENHDKHKARVDIGLPYAYEGALGAVSEPVLREVDGDVSAIRPINFWQLT